MHQKVLPQGSHRVLEILKGCPGLSSWVLAGGTGLALQVGHRVSEDFDFFCAGAPVSPVPGVERFLAGKGRLQIHRQEEDTLVCGFLGVKLSFFSVPDPFLFDPVPFPPLALADLRDIGVMKIVAIANRGCRKDFLDLYKILRGDLPLERYLALLDRKYPRKALNHYQFLKSLVYFADAEKEPLPTLLEPIRWSEVKSFFVREARKILG